MTDPAPRRLPSGHQYEITRGNATVRVGSVAAVLREFSVDGHAFTEIWDDDKLTPHGCGIVLAPWPNRIENARWTNEGKALQLDITDPSNNCAIHGLLRNTSYDLVEITAESVTLGAGVYPQHGYPFTLDTFVTYRLADDGLHVEHTVANVGSGTAPFGVGAHPYLRVGDQPTGSLTVTLHADTYLAVNANKVPTALLAAAGTQWDLRAGVVLGSADLDTAYTDLHPVSGPHGDEHQVALTAPDGSGVLMWAQPSFGYMQVFTPRDFPGRELTVAIEPMTCAANAFNTGQGLRWLAPGESFVGSWGLRPFGF